MMRLTYETGLSLQSRAPFADLIFQKCSDRDLFFTILYEIELLLQSCAPFVFATVLCTFWLKVAGFCWGALDSSTQW